MRLTQEADYALRIVSTLARGGVTMDSRTVSVKACVPERFTVKILRKLVLGGIVASKKGSAGGYMLAVSPDEITMLSVVELIDEPISISRCLDREYECTKNNDKSCCVFHMIFAKLSSRLAEKLGSITIADATDDSVSIESILEKI
ncbi:MAG: RrF2 family transcriptional regulator [Candidatus Flemingiibacterium sp.]